MANEPLISTNEAEIVVEKSTNTAVTNGQIVQKIVIGAVAGVAIILLVLTLMALSSSTSSLKSMFSSSQSPNTLQFH